MKKFLLSAFLIAGMSLSVLAQGTISFQNFTSATAKVYTNNANSGGSTNGATLASAGFTVALLAGPVGTPIGNLTVVATFTSTTGGGQFFDGTTVTIPGVPAGNGTSDTTQNVELAVEGWLGNFSNYAAAIAGGAIAGRTAEFSNSTGGAGTALPAGMTGWTAANSLVLWANTPEPSTIALGSLGAATLLIFRRRKKPLAPTQG